ncbi:YaaL family protein [Lentilactobacillus kribbianus]|uniref:YaaL family protein n=1 Tax=Lentilactobacillus kribbianus TaxID=2729622 RepID=UPI0015525BA7|nr:YaaL family protein [Lentilactobacillus kribbianus]
MFLSLFHRYNVKTDYDERLLELVNDLKEDWDHDQQTQRAVADGKVDQDLELETQLAKQKYFFIYQEARIRQVRNHTIQSSVINHDSETFE